MTPFPSAEQSAIAARLGTDLACYREGLRQLLQHHWDPDLYRSLSEQFDRIQMQAGALPRLSVTWTEVLISRAEMTHALWNLRAPSRINGRVEALHARHGQLVEELLAQCEAYTRRAAQADGAAATPSAKNPRA